MGREQNWVMGLDLLGARSRRLVSGDRNRWSNRPAPAWRTDLRSNKHIRSPYRFGRVYH